MDTFGYVVLEAMAHGLPVLAPGHLALNELIDDDSGAALRAREHALRRRRAVPTSDFTIPLPGVLPRGAAHTRARPTSTASSTPLERMRRRLRPARGGRAGPRHGHMDHRRAPARAHLRRRDELKHPAGVGRAGELVQRAVAAEHAARRRRPRTRRARARRTTTATSCGSCTRCALNSTRGRPTGRREQQLPARREHARELRRRLARAERVERVAVAPEADVLGHVQAAHRLQRRRPRTACPARCRRSARGPRCPPRAGGCRRT